MNSEIRTAKDLARGVAAMEQLEATVKRTADVVLPIWGEKDNGVPFVSGSGFLLQVRDAVFLVTAGHTLKIYPASPLYVSLSKRHVGLNATFTRTKTGDASDLAFARLDERMEGMRGAYRVLTLDDIDVLDWPAAHRMYSFIGYPHSLNKANLREKTFEPTIQPYTSHLPLLLEDYEEQGLNPCSTISVFFDLDHAEQGTSRVVVPKSPIGISGGPVWRLGTFEELDERTNREQVVGLSISFKRKPDLLLGTRIGILLEGIRRRFPELSSELPTNSRCKVNVTVE